MAQAIIDKQYKFLSWHDIDELCLSLYAQMLKDNYAPSAIIGLLRGGVVPSRVLADYFGIVLDFFALDVKMYDKIGVRKEEPVIRYAFKHKDIDGKKILVADDIWDSGLTMKAVMEHFEGKDVATATLLWRKDAAEKPNYYAEVVEKDIWCVFPWEQFEFKREATEKLGAKNEE